MKLGVNEELLQWMASEAKRLKITKKGKWGGLILDEVTIQVSTFIYWLAYMCIHTAYV